MIIPGLKDWMVNTFGASLQHKTPATVSVIHFFVVFSEWQRTALLHKVTKTTMACFVLAHSD